MPTNQNYAPNPYNTQPETVDSLEQLRDLDPAAEVIDTANNLRDASYETGYSVDELGSLFENNDNGRPGGFELIQLAKTLRDENRRDLKPYERQFVDHMNLEAQHDRLHGNVDFDALSADFSLLNDDAAKKAGVEKLIDTIIDKYDNTTDSVEKTAFGLQIQNLKEYLSIIDVEPKAHLENRFMSAGYDDTTAEPGPLKTIAEAKLKDVADEIDDYDSKLSISATALQTIAEYFPRTPDNPADLADDPLLEYTPAFVQTKESQEVIERDRVRRLNEKRQQVADSKTHFLFGSKIGKNIFRKVTGIDVNPGLDKREADYLQLSREDIQRRLADKLSDPTIDPKVKAILVTEAVMEEQARLRELTNEKIKDTPVAKIANWVGKHKIATIAGMAILVPITGGGSLVFGAALGGGMVAASKYDQKHRGMQSVGESFSQSDLIDHMYDGNSLRSAQWLAMSKYERDMVKEKRKRAKALGRGALVACVGDWGIHHAASGVGSFFHN